MRRFLPGLLTLPVALTMAHAQLTDPTSGMAGGLCRPAIDMAERRHLIPGQLLQAIGRIESGRRDPVSGQVTPWPWTINAEGQGASFDTRQQAIAAVNALRARGVRSIDVGCLQVNLMHHPDAFTSMEQAFDPVANADYAARFLRGLFDRTGTWPKAAARYHSATPELGEEYGRKVMAAWPEEQKRPASPGPTALAAAWRATLPQGGHPILGRQALPRLIPLPASPANAGTLGRGLDAYRAAPVNWAYRPPVLPAPVTPPGNAAVPRPGWFLMRR